MNFNFKAFQEELSKEILDVYTIYENNISAISIYTDTGAMSVSIAINTNEHLEERIKEDPDDKCYYKWSTDEWKIDYIESNVLNKLSKSLSNYVLAEEENQFDLFQQKLHTACLNSLLNLGVCRIKPV